ncbi:MAG: HAD-IB family hydrolase [Caldimonas sp.]
MSGGGRLALFDLDGTLLSGDTDALWCEFLMSEGVLDRDAFEAANRDVVERYGRGVITPAEFCAFYAGTLRGQGAAGWAPHRERFVATVIAARIPASARALVDSHRDAGDTLVLTTATNRFLTEPIADLLRVDALIATELESGDAGGDESRVFTGRNAGVLNMREGKVERVHAWLASRGAEDSTLSAATFYSDSINDLPLLRAVGRPVVVDPDVRLMAEAAARGWRVLSLAR